MIYESFAKLGGSARSTTSVVLIVIAAFATYKWTITPQAAYLSSAKGYESTISKIVEQNKSIVMQIENKKKQLKVLRENSDQLQNVLFTADKAEEFFSDLQVFSEQAGCAVYTINRIAEKRDPENKRLGVAASSATLSVFGNYKNMVKLIETLQNRAEKVWIDEVGVQILDSESDQARCDLTITICQIIDKDNI